MIRLNSVDRGESTFSRTGEVEVAVAVEFNASRVLVTRTADVGRVEQVVRSIPGRVELHDRQIIGACESCVVGTGCRGQIRGVRSGHEVDVASAVDDDMAEAFVSATTEIR